MQTNDNDQPKRSGRSKDTPQVRRRVARAILLGATYEAAAGCGGISERTFHRWMDEKESFRRLIEDANGRAQLRLVIDISDSKDWRAKAWMLERRFGWIAARGKTDSDTTSQKRISKSKQSHEQVRQRLLDLLEEAASKSAKKSEPAAKRTRSERSRP